MFRRARGLAATLLALLLALVSARALSAAEPNVSAPTDPDFPLQGEYSGDVHSPAGDQAIGIQVVAQGDGKFTAVSYIGGLPGDGWERSPRQSGKGELKNGSVEFSGQGYTSTVKNGVMSIGVAGVNIAELKKQDRESPSLGAPPPPGAIVLFDGSSADKFEGGKMDSDNLLLPGCTSKEKFGSGKLHLEFRVPFMPKAEGQARGNSGVYLQGRYEVQILDSFGQEEADNMCGAVYGVKPPSQNMAYPPMAWQTYEIDFTAPEFKDGKKVEGSQAMITAKQNGIGIHRRTKVPQPTAGAPQSGEAETGPIYLQDHGNPVRFQNIWFLPGAAGNVPVEPAKPANS